MKDDMIPLENLCHFRTLCTCFQFNQSTALHENGTYYVYENLSLNKLKSTARIYELFTNCSNDIEKCNSADTFHSCNNEFNAFF